MQDQFNLLFIFHKIALDNRAKDVVYLISPLYSCTKILVRSKTCVFLSFNRNWTAVSKLFKINDLLRFYYEVYQSFVVKVTYNIDGNELNCTYMCCNKAFYEIILIVRTFLFGHLSFIKNFG